jgi:hypothetical protein
VLWGEGGSDRDLAVTLDTDILFLNCTGNLCHTSEQIVLILGSPLRLFSGPILALTSSFSVLFLNNQIIIFFSTISVTFSAFGLVLEVSDWPSCL